MIGKCKNCGGMLDGVVCSYCGVRNDIDLTKRYEVHKQTERVCPDCEIFLDTIMIDKSQELYIEKCKHCKGIFLDFGELEALMEREIVKSEKHDLKTLRDITNNPRVREQKIKYKKCPQCRKMMSRLNYQQRSGVIMDRCGSCGYWLDAGELRQIMEWAKLDGLQDFTPTLPEISTKSINSSVKPARSRVYHDRGVDDFLSIFVDGFMRKVYGF